MTREEAIKELRGFIGQLTEGCQEAIKVLIPELAESEDEKREKAIAILKQQRDFWDYEGQKDKCPPAVFRRDLVEAIDIALAYLEKQKDSPMPEDTVVFQKGVAEGRRLEREDNKREWSEEDIQYYNAVMEMVMYSLYLPSRPRNEVIKWLKSLKNRGNFPKSNTNSPYPISLEATKQLLEREIENYYYDNFAFISSAHTPTKDIVSDIATHFYELGQRRVAEMYDEVEYSRQRAEEEMSDKTLDEAAEEYGRKEYSHAIHFWDEGLSKNKPEVMKEDFVDSFKAGAKWMAGQGVSWEDRMTYYDGFLLYGKDERAFTMEGNFNEGDEVIVQIRKKEESK